MIVKPVTQVGNPIIRTKSKRVHASSKRNKAVIRNLIDSMRYHGLVGMAAPQIGINQRIFVTEIRMTKSRKQNQLDPVRIFINPKILSSSRKKIFGYEGCGSVASGVLFGSVKRSQSVVVEAFNEKGKKFRLRASGLLARIIQHEFDHLEGKVFLDRLSDMKSIMSRNEYLRR
ncbi:MAG TPA: peptide deformylase [Candidatus Paceibacterota bacterium]|nr:peptide deformylase [Candidatus Paceibacterota bacterium]